MNTHLEYKKKLYKKIKIELLTNRIVLDVGCGNGEDAYNIAKIAKKVVAFDVERFPQWKKYNRPNLFFKVCFAEKMPFKNNSFDGLFLKDVIHHVKNRTRAMNEINRVTKKGALIILLEGNRYNPFFYVHMTKMLGHEHLSKKNFKKLVEKTFKGAKINFYHFESHYIPTNNKIIINFLKFIEVFMEKMPFFKNFLSYNLAVISK